MRNRSTHTQGESPSELVLEAAIQYGFLSRSRTEQNEFGIDNIAKIKVQLTSNVKAYLRAVAVEPLGYNKLLEKGLAMEESEVERLLHIHGLKSYFPISCWYNWAVACFQWGAVYCYKQSLADILMCKINGRFLYTGGLEQPNL